MARWLRSFVRKALYAKLHAEGDATGVVDPPVGGGDVAGAEGAEGGGTPPPPKQGDQWDPQTYNGPADVNPDNRPLRLSADERRTFSSKEEMERFIREYASDTNLFLTPEEVEAQKAEEEAARAAAAAEKGEEGKEKDKPPDGAEKAGEGGEGKKGAAAGAGTEDAELKEFLAFTDMDEETVRAMPEKARTAMVDMFEKAKGLTPEFETIRQEHGALKQRQTLMDRDPVITARLRELSAGTTDLVARTVPPMSAADVPDTVLTDISAAFDAEDSAKARQTILNLANAYVNRVGPDAVRRERSILSENEKALAEKEAAITKILSIGAGDKPLDKRMAFTRADFDRQTYDENTTLGKFATYLRERQFTPSQINKMTPQEIHAGFSTYMGWDKETNTKIAEETKKRLLATLSKPHSPTSVPPGKRPGASESRTVMEVSEADLKAEIIRGDDERYVRLVQRADARGNLADLKRLEKLYREAKQEAERQPNKR